MCGHVQRRALFGLQLFEMFLAFQKIVVALLLLAIDPSLLGGTRNREPEL